jgi:hypothetical protein
MNYLKLYCKIIRYCEERNFTKKEAKEYFGYCEKHHIFPRSIFGQDKDGNKRIVYVSAREHYILHAILERAFIQRYGLMHWKTAKMTKAHINMACDGGLGKEKKENYYNSRLYESAKIRMSVNTSGKNSPSTLYLRIYFEDGRVIDWYDGVRLFCEENPQYYPADIMELYRTNRKKYKDIIKVEVLNPERIRYLSTQTKEKLKNNVNTLGIPIRIYFNDGRIIEEPLGSSTFTRKYPDYNADIIGLVKNNKKGRYKDIVKVEEYDPQNPGNPQPIITKIYNPNSGPIRIVFNDGRVVDHPHGKAGFCLDNPEYNVACLSSVQRGNSKSHKDIIQVISLEDEKIKQLRSERARKNITSIIPIRVYFADGRIVEEPGGAAEFSRLYPEYNSSAVSSVKEGKMSRCKDILKVEEYDPQNPGNPQPIVKSHYTEFTPIRMYFADGRVIDWYESKAKFCEQNPDYSPQGIANLQHGKGKQHIDMIKVEEIDPDNPTEPVPIIKKLKKIKPSAKIPIRIYFNDGRILDYPEGKYRFCEDYPEYDRNGLLRLEKGRKNPYKDIVKVEQYDPQNPGNPQPIYGRPTKSTCHPMRIYFADGRVIDWYEGKAEFCRQNSQYNEDSMRTLQNKKTKRHKDIIRIDVLDYTINTPTTL